MKQIILVIMLLIKGSTSMAQQHEWVFDKLEKPDTTFVFKDPERELVEMFVYNIFDTIPVCNNKEAKIVFWQKINTLKFYISTKDEKLQAQVMTILLNFELLTKIESESDADFIGKYNPTNKDVERWEDWFCMHKDEICWYQKKHVLFLKRCK